MEKIIILGSTGSVGCSALQVINLHKDKFKVFALSANVNVDLLTQQCIEFKPQFAVALNPKANKQLKKNLLGLSSKTIVLDDEKALEWIASHDESEIVISSIVGAAGLKPTMAAVNSGKKILLANKETLVMAGHLFMNAIKETNATLIPIDSEHNAIMQVLSQDTPLNYNLNGVKKILLTASGGPFRTLPNSQFSKVTPQEALCHPNWIMGKKITIDSATMMNKGLEVIEAHWLFNVPLSKIEVIIHPQSIVHSFVEYVDGSVLAQLGNPDMRSPIAYALSQPNRIESGVSSLDLVKIGRLDFEAPDLNKFPCLSLAYEAAKMGQNATTILNAANEIAVNAFLETKISFDQIPKVIESAIFHVAKLPINNLDDVINTDFESRNYATSWINKNSIKN